MFAKADESGTCGDNLTWTYVEATKTLTISGSGAMRDYDHEFYNNISNRTTGPWKNYYHSMETVVIESGVTSIGQKAFFGCSKLTSVTIPNSLTSIGVNAFAYCHGLTYITIPNSVTSIEEVAFYACHGLTSITIPEGVKSIGDGAFMYCINLTSVTLPNSLTSIGENLFSYCYGLTSVTISEGVKSIGKYAFYECYSLTSITIPNSVNIIGRCAFEECTDLASITILNSVTSIDEWAFADCTKLADVYCYAETLPSTSSNAFYRSNIKSSTLHVPASAINKYRTMEPWSGFGMIVALPRVTYWIDGQIYKQTAPIMGGSIIPEPTPLKEGYTFSGWSEIPETMPDHDVTVTGTFSINQYTIKFVVEGEEVASKTQDYQTAVTAPEIPEREGYTFAWDNLPQTVPAHDIIVTGTFTANTYKLSYFVENQHMQTIDVIYNSPIVPLEWPTKEGYTFLGWSEIPETMPAHDVTVTGSFTINHYTLTLMVGDNVYETKTLDYGSAIVVPEMPELTGYTFTWGEVPATMPAQDVTIIGEYQPNLYNVTYLIDGQFYAIYKVAYGSTITPPEVPEHAGSTFTWGEYPEKMPAHDIIIEGTYTDGIDLVQRTHEGTEFYTLDGKKVNRLQRGVNIIRRGSKVMKVKR